MILYTYIYIYIYMIYRKNPWMVSDVSRQLYPSFASSAEELLTESSPKLPEQLTGRSLGKKSVIFHDGSDIGRQVFQKSMG